MTRSRRSALVPFSRHPGRGRSRSRAAWSMLLALVMACEQEQTMEVAPRKPASPRVEPQRSRPSGRVSVGRIYIPTYSHIYVREGIAEDLAVTLSVRNVSVNHELVLESVGYYDTSGKLLEELMPAPATVRPLETVEFFISTKDQRGGSGANAIIGWHSSSPVIPPLVEAVMVRSLSSNQSYSFTTRGIEIPTDIALQTQAPAEASSAGEDAEGGDAP